MVFVKTMFASVCHDNTTRGRDCCRLAVGGRSPTQPPTAGFNLTSEIENHDTCIGLPHPGPAPTRQRSARQLQPAGFVTGHAPESGVELDGPGERAQATSGTLEITDFLMDIEWWDEKMSVDFHEAKIKEMESDLEVFKDRLNRLQDKSRKISFSIQSYKITLPMLKEYLLEWNYTAPEPEDDTSNSSVSEDECIQCCDLLNALMRALSRVKDRSKRSKEKSQTVTTAIQGLTNTEPNQFLFTLPSFGEKMKMERSFSESLRLNILENCGTQDHKEVLKKTVHNLEQHIIPYKENVLSEVISECYRLQNNVDNLQSQLESMRSFDPSSTN